MADNKNTLDDIANQISTFGKTFLTTWKAPALWLVWDAVKGGFLGMMPVMGGINVPAVLDRWMSFSIWQNFH